jgi:HlyD family secretion protein
MPWRTLGALALIIVGVGAVFVAVFGPTLAKSDTTQYITSQASVTNVVNDVVADGNLAAAQTYGLAFGSDPALVSSSSSASGGSSGTWLVKEVDAKVGQQVKQGDVLAIADTTDLQNALDLAQANLASAQAKSTTDMGGPSSTDQQSAQLSIDQAQQQVDSAIKSRDNTASQNAIKLTQAQDAVSTAQSQLKTDRANNAPSTVTDADKQKITQAKQDLQLAKVQIQASNQQANQQVSSAQLSLQSAKNNATSQTAPASDQTIASDKASLLQAQQNVANAQQELDGATITAPTAGTIIVVNIVPGATAPSGDAIELMTTELDVTADFAESDIPNLAVGQSATVTISATGDVVPGTVTAIAPVAATSGSGSVVSYAVTVQLQSSPAKALPGMSAQVAVTIAESDNVVAVPAIALIGTSGNYAVRVMGTNNAVSVVPVQVGLVTTSLAEIKSGVSAGDTIVTGTASSLTSTSTSGTTGFPAAGLGGGGAFPGGGTFVRGGGTRTTTGQ